MVDAHQRLPAQLARRGFPMKRVLLSSTIALLVALPPLTARVADLTDVPPAIAAAVADSHRPAEEVRLDILRQPARLLAFAGVKPGDVVADFMPGNGYFTRLLSKVAGPTGRVYAFIPEEQVKNCPPREIAGSREIERDPSYTNVTMMTDAVDRLAMPRQLDVLWTAQNYHDLHDTFMGPANIKGVNQAFFNALKPGGVLIVIDHAAAAGSGLRDTETLHRIDPVTLRKEIEAAGFVFESQDNALANAADDHSRSVFDPLIRGKTDQFVFKFRKPVAWQNTI
jgi:predicted methyltransferase